MTIEHRRSCEIELIQLYYDGMKRHGANISMQEVMLEYQQGLALMLIIFVIAQKDCQLDSQRATDLVRTCQARKWAHICDLGFENAMKVIWSLPVEDVCGRNWSQEELAQLLPEKYLSLCAASDGASIDVSVVK
jgi:hypothetical protein